MNDLETIKNDQDRLLDRAIDSMLERARATIASDLTGFPHYADTDTGRWTTTEDGFWTGGFWPGVLWLSGYYSNDRTFWTHAEEWTDRFESRVDSESVFRGFLFYFAGALGGQLAGNDRAANLAVRAARSLRQSFNEHVGVIPLGGQAEEAHTVGETDSNIDSLSASLVMMWAADYANDDDLRQVAITHALKNADFCVRSDGSVCQSATFDGKTGAVVRNFTHKGYSHDSTWTRAQAWAMLGYGFLAGKAPEEPRILELADRVTSWWMENVPDDLVAYWDFDAPRTPETKRDTAGTAIASSAMFRLAVAHPDRTRALAYQRLARETTLTLCRDYLTPTSETDQRQVGILTQGCFDHTRDVATDNELIWGDYFLLESLGVLSGALPLGRINI